MHFRFIRENKFLTNIWVDAGLKIVRFSMILGK